MKYLRILAGGSSVSFPMPDEAIEDMRAYLIERTANAKPNDVLNFCSGNETFAQIKACHLTGWQIYDYDDSSKEFQDRIIKAVEKASYEGDEWKEQSE